MNKSVAFYICALMTCVNAITSLIFSLLELSYGPSGEPGIMYSIARTVCLACAAIFGAATGSADVMFVLAPLLGSIQACDAVVGWLSHDFGKTIGPVFLSILTFASVVWLARRRNDQQY